MTGNDASREGSGAAVDFSRSTTQDVAVSALTPRSPVEADAPEEATDDDSAILTARYKYALQMIRAAGYRTYPDDIEAYVATLPSAYAIADATFSLRAENTRLSDRVSQLEATVAELTRDYSILRDGANDLERERDAECAARLAAEQETERLRAALERITKREGRFSRDPHTHAENTIEDMATIAAHALAAVEAK